MKVTVFYFFLFLALFRFYCDTMPWFAVFSNHFFIYYHFNGFNVTPHLFFEVMYWLLNTPSDLIITLD